MATADSHEVDVGDDCSAQKKRNVDGEMPHAKKTTVSIKAVSPEIFTCGFNCM
jgi:hypothetical protein